MRFFRSKVYTEYFEYLDRTGGFYYERWGDAPVHSIAATFFLPKEEIHFFGDIGYRHSPYIRCPQDEASHLSGRCSCERGNNFGTFPSAYQGLTSRLRRLLLRTTMGQSRQDSTKHRPHKSPRLSIIKSQEIKHHQHIILASIFVHSSMYYTGVWEF